MPLAPHTLSGASDGESAEDDILELYEAASGEVSDVDVASNYPDVALRLRDAIGDWMESTQRDRGTRLEGDGAYEFLRGLGCVGGD